MSNVYKSLRARIVPLDVFSRFVPVIGALNPESIITKRLAEYMESLGYSSMFPNFDKVRISNIHPFAMLFAQDVFEQPKNIDVFPSITVADLTTEEDAEVMGNDYSVFSFSVEEVEVMNGYRIAKEVYVADAGWAKVVERAKANGFVVGVRKRYHTSDSLSLNIWTQNRDMTNLIFDIVMQFLEQSRADMHVEDGLDILRISGRRSGDFNVDYGIQLFGADVQAQATMDHEGVLFDLSATTITAIDTTTLPTYFVSGGS